MDLGAVILAGGAGRRLGGADKPALAVSGRPMLLRVLDAVPLAAPRVVVGPARPDLPGDVARAMEEPPGGGPVAATAAGLAVVLAAPRPPSRIALLAGDLPYLTATAVAALCARLDQARVEGALVDGGLVDGVVFVDGAGRRQALCGVWRTGPLADRFDAVGEPAGCSMRALLAGLAVAEISAPAGAAPPPWFDCDTEDDLRRAEEWRP